jgi:phosphoribosylformylglycinamidine cyclo-ligase
MHRTFNMGTGFVAALDPEAAESLAAATDGRVIGRVAETDATAADDEAGTVSIRGMEL